ncbi:hypothetical protein [Natranaerobius trueperi]|uniref:Uncharacterized protein n=1 Tax=Natranaerobius trueperi TaxID=759412 RepID=A0A226C1Z8_9FIRM|nr:hypothetical protein [Natranaerobius trueperi]OWZ84624.1 hypothetical protein CDO51_02365 [Natranaerobius trueperi]
MSWINICYSMISIITLFFNSNIHAEESLDINRLFFTGRLLDLQESSYFPLLKTQPNPKETVTYQVSKDFLFCQQVTLTLTLNKEKHSSLLGSF